MKKISVFSFFFFFVACGDYRDLQKETQNACYFNVKYGFVVKWDQLPIPIYVHESTPRLSRDNFVYAMDMWNESWNYYTQGGGRLFELVGDANMEYIPSNLDDGGDGINIFFLDRKHKILRSHQQGSTQIRNYFSGSIVEADIIINNVNYRYFYEKEDFDHSAYTNVPKLSTARSLASTVNLSFWKRFVYSFNTFLDFLAFWERKHKRFPAAKKVPISNKQVDFLSLSLHELGHVAAVTHIEDRNSIMYFELEKGQIRRNISDIELANLACGYLQ